MNHVSADGYLVVDECKRSTYLREPDLKIIVQDTCEPEPRLDLILQKLDNYWMGQGPGQRRLDMAQVTALRDALSQFISDFSGETYWQHNGVRYNLEMAWEARVGTPWEEKWFRHVDRFRDGAPLMRMVGDDAESELGEVIEATLPEILGLPWSDEPEIDQDYVDSLEQWDMQRSEL